MNHFGYYARWCATGRPHPWSNFIAMKNPGQRRAAWSTSAFSTSSLMNRRKSGVHQSASLKSLRLKKSGNRQSFNKSSRRRRSLTVSRRAWPRYPQSKSPASTFRGRRKRTSSCHHRVDATRRSSGKPPSGCPWSSGSALVSLCYFNSNHAPCRRQYSGRYRSPSGSFP